MTSTHYIVLVILLSWRFGGNFTVSPNCYRSVTELSPLIQSPSNLDNSARWFSNAEVSLSNCFPVCHKKSRRTAVDGKSFASASINSFISHVPENTYQILTRHRQVRSAHSKQPHPDTPTPYQFRLSACFRIVQSNRL